MAQYPSFLDDDQEQMADLVYGSDDQAKRRFGLAPYPYSQVGAPASASPSNGLPPALQQTPDEDLGLGPGGSTVSQSRPAPQVSPEEQRYKELASQGAPVRKRAPLWRGLLAAGLAGGTAVANMDPHLRRPIDNSAAVNEVSGEAGYARQRQDYADKLAIAKQNADLARQEQRDADVYQEHLNTVEEQKLRIAAMRGAQEDRAANAATALEAKNATARNDFQKAGGGITEQQPEHMVEFPAPPELPSEIGPAEAMAEPGTAPAPTAQQLGALPPQLATPPTDLSQLGVTPSYKMPAMNQPIPRGAFAVPAPGGMKLAPGQQAYQKTKAQETEDEAVAKGTLIPISQQDADDAAAAGVHLPAPVGSSVNSAVYNKFQDALKKTVAPAANKKVTSKEEFQGFVAKMQQAGELPLTAQTDVNTLAQAISQSKSLSPEERAGAMGYITTNVTPASTATNQQTRATEFGKTRIYPVINKATGNEEMASANEIAQNPGLYMGASPGQNAMARGTFFNEVHYNIDTAKNAVSAFKEMTPESRAKIAFALRTPPTDSAIQAFMSGEVGRSLNPAEAEFVQAILQLRENGLGVRGAAMLGQGAQDLRDAVRAVLPSAASPTPEYAMQQLLKFEQIVNRLEKAVPGIKPSGKAAEGQAPPAQPQATHVWTPTGIKPIGAQ